ncbi:hypothetical protein DNTS_004463 [Danionella cerebrum]|uniref:Sulfotransferase n=1 Tax=Danionella cerebrum TaxID=2873325 RepID=A0A553PZD4_9TELE|nr:hypothetical protein DNTS_004463 [Danionella translucida]
MGCWTPSSDFGHLKAHSRVSVLFTMILIITFLFYCLSGYCESVQLYTLQSFRSKLLPVEEAQATLQPHAHRNGSVSRELSDQEEKRQEGFGYDSHSNLSVSNNFGTKEFPQAIIIGVKKGGTRALLEFLRVHPDVRAVGAEPHFFDRFYQRGLHWYRNLMPRSLEGQITMEKTPSYFITPEAPSRVSSMSPSTRLIVVVRDPVTRAVSDYTQTLSKNPSLPSFQSLVFRNGSGAVVDPSWSAVRIGIYVKHLERWLRFFPLEQMLFVSGERLVSDPAGEMARVQDFLGLKRVVGEKHFYFNQTKGFPCLKKPEGSSHPRCLGKSKGRAHPQIQEDVLQRLRDFYRPFNRKFYQMTGQDFGWD